MFPAFKPFQQSQVLSYLLIGLISGIGLGIRLINLGYKSFWLDEAVIYQISQNRLSDLLKSNAATNSAPPLYPILVDLVSKLGDNESALRLISVLGGFLAILAAYLLGKKILKGFSALTLAFFAAFLFVPFSYSQELREYSMTLFLSFTIQYAFVRFIEHDSYKNASLLLIASLVGIFTQYGLSLLILAINVIFAILLILRKTKRELVSRWVLIQLVNLTAVMVVFFTSLRSQMKSGGFGIQYLGAGYWNGQINSVLQFFTNNTRGILRFFFPYEGVTLGLLILGLIYLLLIQKKWMAVGLSLIPLFLVFIFSLFRLYPYLGARQNMFLLPGLLIPIGAGLEWIWQKAGELKGKWKSWAARFILIAGIGIYIWPAVDSIHSYILQPSREQVGWAVEVLDRYRQPQDRIYVYYSTLPSFNYHLRHQLPDLQVVKGVAARKDPERYFMQLDQLLSQPGPVWMIFSHCYGNECKDIVHYTMVRRTIKEVYNQYGAQLVLAQ